MRTGRTVPAAVGNSVASLSRALVGAIEAAQSGDKLRSLEESSTNSPTKELVLQLHEGGLIGP
jgi:hypothetical protein